MDRIEFEQALDRHGGDLKRWPDEARRQAEALLAADPQARRMHEAALRLDRLLAEAVAPQPVDAAMLGRALSRGAVHTERALKPTRRLAAFAGAAMAACLMVGYIAGVALPASDGEDTLAGLMFGSSSSATSDAEGVL